MASDAGCSRIDAHSTPPSPRRPHTHPSPTMQIFHSHPRNCTTSLGLANPPSFAARSATSAAKIQFRLGPMLEEDAGGSQSNIGTNLPKCVQCSATPPREPAEATMALSGLISRQNRCPGASKLICARFQRQHQFRAAAKGKFLSALPAPTKIRSRAHPPPIKDSCRFCQQTYFPSGCAAKLKLPPSAPK